MEDQALLEKYAQIKPIFQRIEAEYLAIKRVKDGLEDAIRSLAKYANSLVETPVQQPAQKSDPIALTANESTVLDAIPYDGVITQIQISNRTSVPLGSVKNITPRLQTFGLIRKATAKNGRITERGFQRVRVTSDDVAVT